MLAILALVLIAIVALTILGFAVHVLFSPWLLLAVIGERIARSLLGSAQPLPRRQTLAGLA